MVKLTALSACDGLLPKTFGPITLREITPDRITALLPYRGQTAALSKALQTAHGLGFPEPNRVTSSGDVRCVWAGLDQAFLLGAQAHPSLSRHAALVDQSDSWATVEVHGAGTDQVLARLVPVDLRGSAFPVGHTARSLVGHMSAVITRIGPDALQVMVFRSMAQTLVHELEVAAQQVVARAHL